MAYMHAFRNSVGAQPVQQLARRQRDRQDQMYENSLGIAYSMKLK